MVNHIQHQNVLNVRFSRNQQARTENHLILGIRKVWAGNGYGTMLSVRNVN
jgi:hypothetical protein